MRKLCNNLQLQGNEPVRKVKSEKLKVKSGTGYTLIEILVSITIIALLFIFGYASFREFSRRQAINSAVRVVRGDLRLAQQQALAGNKPADPKCNAPNLLDGYYFRAASTSYTIEAACSGVSGGPVTTKSVSLSSDISMTAPSPNPILFKVLGQGTNISSTATVVLTQAGTNNTQTITITSGGEIK